MGARCGALGDMERFGVLPVRSREAPGRLPRCSRESPDRSPDAPRSVPVDFRVAGATSDMRFDMVFTV